VNAPDPVRTFDGLASRIDATGMRCVGITSALLGEGVSTIALGTALSLATLRPESVLLVDANWMQPSLTADADLLTAPGLADALAGKCEVTTLIRRAAAPRPSFLPIGDRAAARPTLRGLSRFLTGGALGYETVLVDLPPVLAGETYVLPWAALVDQVFLVLREAATPLPAVREALEKLGTATPPQIVLNRGMAPSADATAALLAVRA